MTAQLLILFMLFQSSPTVRGQYVADYKKIAEVYNSAPSLSFTIKFKSFDSNAQRPDTAFDGRYIYKANNVYNKIGTAETFVNGKYRVGIDHANKVIFLNYSNGKKSEITPFQMVDSIVQKYKCNISMTDIDNEKTRRYTVEYPMPYEENVTAKMIMEFDKKTYLVSRLVIYMPPNEDPYNTGKVNLKYRPFVEFNYLNYSFNAVSDEVFSTDKFFAVNGKEAALKDPYKKYQLISSLSLLNQANR